MAALVWLLIPVMAVCVAGLWSSWAARKRTNGGGDAAGVAGYDAFRSAMERSGQRKAPAMSPTPDDGVPDDAVSTDSTAPTEPAKPSGFSGPVVASDAGSRASGALRTSAEQTDTMLSADPLSEDPVFSDPMSGRVPTGVSTDSPSRAAD